ncbi:MAG: histidine phosphatase family protein [Candidatus Lokiarchaeota archaeon]|nr:histidine phosphatase family protein [Candidatus Harpocratesius repetitus]
MHEIILIQHCQSEHHVNELSGGWTDTPLTELGRKQAILIGKRLKNEIDPNNFQIFSSDLKRALQTAEIIGNYLNLSFIVEKNLREINTGVAAGKTKEWAKQHRNPENKEIFDLDYQEFNEGESRRQFFNRVCACMEQITSSQEKNLIIVTHGWTLAYIVAWWLKFDESLLKKAHFWSSTASLSYLLINQYKQHTLRKFNDTSHLINY